MFKLFAFVLASLMHAACTDAHYDQEWVQKLKDLEKLVTQNNNELVGQRRLTGTEYFNVTFECTPKPTTVHQLRPRDIDVVGAMGDSITVKYFAGNRNKFQFVSVWQAGNGIEATTIAEVGVEDRGLSWTIGGDLALETSLTIPNILKKFNPAVKGFSTGNRLVERELWYNAAVPGARSRDMATQARNLIEKMKNDSRTNFENDWKLISIFIGGNDLCALNRDNEASPKKYVEHLRDGLDILHAELPRALVNVIEILEIYLLPQVGNGFGSTPQCRAAQTTFCNYIVTADQNETLVIIEKNKQYQNYTQQLISSGRYDTRDDFTVVLQPFFRDTVLPYTEDGQVDATFFAPDCFHFSSKGHAMGALNLWNNMLEPVGNKTTSWNITDLKCPTEEAPYFYTRLNSGNAPAGHAQEPNLKNKIVIVDPTQSVAKEEWKKQLEDLKSIDARNGVDNGPRPKSTGTDYFNISMECAPAPTTVHQLRPTDIDIVGAMGDSITAGSGADATSVAGIAISFRGVSWTVGGDANLTTSITIPNIIRHFNPAVKGYSTGQSPNSQLWFNAAVPGARSRNMPEQARELIDMMQNDSRTNYENDWKLISIFIGGNDLCALNRDNDASPEMYVEYLKQGLDILHQEIPRALVNVIDILEIYLLPQVGSGFGATPQCRAAQATFCNYVVTANDTELEKIKEKNTQYQVLTKQLIDSGRYDTRDDFTVVLQPFLRDSVLPLTESGEVDSTYFAPDCFHFSTKGHAMGAMNLWNNLLEPVGNKSTIWKISDLKCPTEAAPFFYTSSNSPLITTTTNPATGTTQPSTTTPQPDTTTLQPDTSTKPIVITNPSEEEKTTSGGQSQRLFSFHHLLVAFVAIYVARNSL